MKTPRYDDVYFEAMQQMDKAEGEWNNYHGKGKQDERDIDVRDDITQWKPRRPSLIRHTSAADRQAFDDLYNAIQEIGTITQRGIKNGEKGHKQALQKIMAICRGVE